MAWHGMAWHLAGWNMAMLGKMAKGSVCLGRTARWLLDGLDLGPYLERPVVDILSGRGILNPRRQSKKGQRQFCPLHPARFTQYPPPPPHTVAGKQCPPARTPAGLHARRVFLLLAWSPVVPVIHQSSISPTFRPSSLSPQAKPAPLLPSRTPHPALRPTQPLRHPASQPHLDVSSHLTTTTLHNPSTTLHHPRPPRPSPNLPPRLSPTRPRPGLNNDPSSPPPAPNPLDPPHPPPHHPPLLPLLAPPNNLPPPLQLPPPSPPSPLLLLPPPLLVLPARRRRPRPDPAAATTPARVARRPVPAASAVAACRCGGGRRWGRGRGGYRVGRVHEQRQGGGFCEEWEREGDYGVESGDECGVVGGGEGWFVSLSFPTQWDGG